MFYELLTNAQMAEAERLTAEREGIFLFSLMEKAGQAVADAVRTLYPGRKILILCGPGNNGGDGFIAARRLHDAGCAVRVACLVQPGKLKGDAAKAAGEWRGVVLDFGALILDPDDVIIDAVFGTGFKGQLEDPVAPLFRRIAAQGNAVLAVDIPSGVNGSTGEAASGTLRAAVTVTFFRKKPGHVLLPAAPLCGTVRVADIGIPAGVLATTGHAARENAPEPWQGFVRPKKPGDNKYSHGHVLIYGGSRLTGAACLAGHAALRIGAGLCTIAAAPEAADVYRAYLPVFMVEPCAHPSSFGEHLEDERRNAVLIGPGAGLDDEKGLRQAVLDACSSNRPCVLDADALTVFKDEPATLFSALHENCVLTPHSGEFSRLFPDLTGTKIERAAAAARLAGAVVLLKGADTVIAAPDGRIVVNAHAPPTLATGGSGDVLAGMIAGLLARHAPPFEAACAAAWMHGEAARLFGPGLVATDIIDRIPAVLAEFA